MNRLSRTVLPAIVGVCVLQSPAMAERADHPPALLTLLSGIDTVPSAAHLGKAAKDPQAAMLRVAMDPTLHPYLRRRATSLLSAFPDEVSEAYLTFLATTQTLPGLRWIAIYTYGRGWGKRAPKRVLGFLDIALGSPIAKDRDAAVRSLRWHPATKRVDALLDRTEAVEKDPAVKAAIARVRAKR